jgi:hypothetical protein
VIDCSNNNPRLNESSTFLCHEVVVMIRPRRCFAFIFAVLLAPVLQAQEKREWAVDRSLTVSPARDVLPALKYRLLPPSWDLREGNAVPIYLRLSHEQNSDTRKYWTETPQSWNDLPIDQIPLEDARKFLKSYRYMLRQLELGTRRRTADWNYTTEEPHPIGLLLPDCQTVRTYVPMLILQARVALAASDFSKAVYDLQTSFAFCRQFAEGPTLIHSVIAVAIANEVVEAVADFVERPDSPNLYWALTALPQPFVDLQKGLAFEYRTVEGEFPDLSSLDRERTPEEWDNVVRSLRTSLRALAKEGAEPGRTPAWFPKDFDPNASPAKSPELPEARGFVARSKGLSAEKVEAMPPAKVLLLYMLGTFQQDRDDLHRATYLPYPQARTVCDSAARRLLDAPATEGHLLARLFLPGLNPVMRRQILLDRNLAAMRVVEALRIYASGHDGKLPNKLDEVTEVPIPADPGTGRPFEYRRDGDAATLISQIPGDQSAQSGIRYRVTIRKK